MSLLALCALPFRQQSRFGRVGFNRLAAAMNANCSSIYTCEWYLESFSFFFPWLRKRKTSAKPQTPKLLRRAVRLSTGLPQAVDRTVGAGSPAPLPHSVRAHRGGSPGGTIPEGQSLALSRSVPAQGAAAGGGRHSLNDRSFGAPCRGEHDTRGEAAAQVLRVQPQQRRAALQRRLAPRPQRAAPCEQRHSALVTDPCPTAPLGTAAAALPWSLRLCRCNSCQPGVL